MARRDKKAAEPVADSPVKEESAPAAPESAPEAAPVDGVIQPDDHTPEQTPGEDVGATDPDTGFGDSEPEPEPVAEGDVTVIVVVGISGLRNGVPWPAAGEQFVLPADEAADYIKFGYVRPVE